MIIHVDISGQVEQTSKDSALGFRRNDGGSRCVKMRVQTKKAVFRKYKGQIYQLPEKLYCILIYYCVKDYLKNVNRIVVCNDMNFQRVARLLPFLFKGHSDFEKIKVKSKKTENGRSDGHYPALKGFRKNKYVDLFITKDMIERKLLEFK